MFSPQKILDTYYLEARRDLLELAALLDRYDAAVTREGAPAEDSSKLAVLRQAFTILADADASSPGQDQDRTNALLNLFSEI